MKETATQLPFEKKSVGTSPWRVDGIGLVTGTAKFVDDMFFKNLLHAKILGSPHAHARILDIDTTEAEKLPGVRYILRWDDPEVMKSEIIGKTAGFFGIDRALANRPAALLADEPTGNLDSKSSADILSMLQQLNAEGMTIVLVTHDPNIAKGARRVLRLKDGLLE